jgi:hypothetical protein
MRDLSDDMHVSVVSLLVWLCADVAEHLWCGSMLMLWLYADVAEHLLLRRRLVIAARRPVATRWKRRGSGHL